MTPPPAHRGFTLLELTISLALISVLLAVLLPALASARVVSSREQCASNLRHCGHAWHSYLEDHAGAFPHVPAQPAWHYAGVRFSPVDDRPVLDPRRPLNPYLPSTADAERGAVVHCPADAGITDEAGTVGTGRRTAFRSFGTSYRANAALFDTARPEPDGSTRRRGLHRDEIATVPTRLVVMGDPIWYEVHRATGRQATWHGEPGHGNLLFLDGSVKYMRIFAPPRVGPAVYEPKLH
jgi:prepilin-type N-terminal cleavage/methylation domain-containing protein/prepilin-type processing-associated H-X9-DG protein